MSSLATRVHPVMSSIAYSPARGSIAYSPTPGIAPGLPTCNTSGEAFSAHLT